MGLVNRSPPEGVVLGPLSQQVFDVLAESASFPWAILMVQCKRAGLDPENLGHGDLPALIAPLADAVGRFTSPEEEASVRARLETLTG